MRARENEPHQNGRDDPPNNQGTVRPAGKSPAAAAAAAAAKASATPAEQFFERGHVRRAAEATAARAARRVAPRTIALGVIARWRLAAAVAAAGAPGTFAIGEEAANAAAPPGNHRHRVDYRERRGRKTVASGAAVPMCERWIILPTR